MNKKWIYMLMVGTMLQAVPGALQAQGFRFGAKAGISVPNLTSGGSSNNPLSTGYKSILGPDFALFGEYAFSKLFSLQLSAEYSAQGGGKNGNQAVPVPAEIASQYPPGQVPPYVWASFDARAEINYLMFPLLAKFNFNLAQAGRLKWYVDAGPFVAFLLSAKTISSGNSNIYLDQGNTQPVLSGPISLNSSMSIKDQLHAANTGIEGDLGLSYDIGKIRTFLEAGGNYGFIIIQKDKSNGQNNTGAATVRAGVSLRVGK